MFYKRSKYHNKKFVVDGVKFDSKKESRRYVELCIQESSGFISELELQPEFILQEKFRHNGKMIRAIKYRADFKYKNKSGDIIIEDVKSKGTRTTEYKIKRKLFLKKYPELDILET